MTVVLEVAAAIAANVASLRSRRGRFARLTAGSALTVCSAEGAMGRLSA
jgi:hypothetical protein